MSRGSQPSILPWHRSADAGVALYRVVLLVWGLDWLPFVVGLFSGGLFAMAISMKDEPPELIAKWGRGAEGEEKTGKAVAHLLDEGWTVRHDVDLGRGNADHILRSPAGAVYLLETTNLAGTVAVERGILTQRYLDDPLQVHRIDLGRQVTELRVRVAAEWSRRTRKPAPSIEPIVVIWGRFPQGTATYNDEAYVAGERLDGFLQAFH